MTRFAFQTDRNWGRYKVFNDFEPEKYPEGFYWEHSADAVLADLRGWWTTPIEVAKGLTLSPAQQFANHGNVIVAVSPGDMTEYRMILTDVADEQLPGKSWIAVALLNTYGTCADFGPIELEEGKPYAHETAYVSSKLRIPEGHEACGAGPVITLLLGLACQVMAGQAEVWPGAEG